MGKEHNFLEDTCKHAPMLNADAQSMFNNFKADFEKVKNIEDVGTLCSLYSSVLTEMNAKVLALGNCVLRVDEGKLVDRAKLGLELAFKDAFLETKEVSDMADSLYSEVASK